MKGSKLGPQHPLRLAAAIAAALLLPAVAAPAAAADEEVRGWFVMLDAALSQPNSFDQHVANVFADVTGTPAGSPLVVVNEDDISYRAGAGYAFGGLGSLRVTYWTFDNDDRQVGTLDGYFVVEPVIFGAEYLPAPTLYAYPTYPIYTQVDSSIEASTIDIDYVRPMAAGEKMTVNWLVGVRGASFEETVSIIATDTFNSNTVFQARTLDSDAVGLRFGATAVFGFTDHFRLEGGAAISFMQAETESMAINSFTSVPIPGLETRMGSNDNVRGEIRDFDVKAVFTSGPVDYFIGYSASDWDGLVADPAPSPGTAFSGVQGRRDSVSFNGLTGGIRIRFGPGS